MWHRHAIALVAVVGILVLSLLHFHAVMTPTHWRGVVSMDQAKKTDVVESQGANVTVKFTLTGRVVLLTVVTSDRFIAFDGFDDYYRRMWGNRLHFAEAHGIQGQGRIDTVGYEIFLVDARKYPISKQRSPVWAKLAAVMEAFEKYPDAEWVWWLDMDAIIMSSSVDLYTYLLDPDVLEGRLRKGEDLFHNERIKEPDQEHFETGEVLPRQRRGLQKNMNPRDIDLICAQDANGLNLGSFFIRNTELMRMFVDMWSDILLIDHAERHWVLKEQDLLLHLIYQHPKLRRRVGWVQQYVINAYADGDEAVKWKPGDLAIHFPDCQ
jgi:galactosyl transferase GMA12/MNN10 family